MIDLSNREQRRIKTPEGIGTYWGISPVAEKMPECQEITVSFPGAKTMTFRAGECEELTSSPSVEEQKAG
jgi:hypothetical protein